MPTAGTPTLSLAARTCIFLGRHVRLLFGVFGTVGVGVFVITSATAADKPPDGYDRLRPSIPDKPPSDYVDGSPYWLPSELRYTPSGLVGFPLWQAEFGGRYFGSSGGSRLDLFAFPPGATGNPLVSRLSYRDLTAHSGEIFGRVEHATGFFVKGYGGGGAISSGTLQDEDFAPFIVPYSSTISEQGSGRLAYGTVDVGWAWRTQTFKLGFFAGYFHYFERLNAFGCIQTAGNPFVCPPGAVVPSTQVIRQETDWDAARLGFATEWRMTERWKLTTEVAWLPYVNISARDTHLLRIGACNECFSGPIPENGRDALTSVQLEAILSYALTEAFSLGVGARYWNVHTQAGNTTVHFETASVFPAFPQAATFRTERWGAFIQGSYKFGQLPASVF